MIYLIKLYAEPMMYVILIVLCPDLCLVYCQSYMIQMFIYVMMPNCVASSLLSSPIPLFHSSFASVEWYLSFFLMITTWMHHQCCCFLFCFSMMNVSVLWGSSGLLHFCTSHDVLEWLGMSSFDVSNQLSVCFFFKKLSPK